MNQINRLLNTIVITITAVIGGYVAYASSGFGLMQSPGAPDDSWFRSAVLEQSQPVVVKFGAEWCGPCRMLDPQLDRLARDGQIKVVKIDIQQNRELALHYRVSSIPHLYLFHKGAVIAHRAGYSDYDRLQEWVKQHLSQ